MKRVALVSVAVVLVMIAFLVGTAEACIERPEKPVCPDGYITVQEAQWVEGTPGTQGYCNTPTFFGTVVYKHDGNSANCSLKNEWNWLHQKPWKWDQTIQGAWVPGTPATEGYWTQPVCELPPPDPVCEDEAANNYGGELPCTYDPPPALCDDPLALNYQQEGECAYPPPTPEPPPYCKPYNVGTWYECNTGNSTWSAPSASKCWCQGLTGRVHYHTTYDCGKSYVTEGNWDEAPDWLGHYPGEVCPVGGC